MKTRKLRSGVILALMAAMLISASSTEETWIVIRGVFGADSVGNDIKWIYVEQYDGATWQLVNNYTATGGEDRILDSQMINFTVQTCYNKTYAASEAEALSFTKVNITISELGGSPIVGWNNILCNESATVGSDANFYFVISYANWSAPLPVAGKTYNCTFLYQSYW